jgi:hypothetical protein
VVVTASAKFPDEHLPPGPPRLSLSLAVSAIADRASVEALLADVVRAIGSAPKPSPDSAPDRAGASTIGIGKRPPRIGVPGRGAAKPRPPSECPKPAPLPATVVAMEPLNIARPGLEMRVDPPADAVDALHASWLAEQTLAFARRIEEAFVAEVKSRAGKLGGLPPDWPARSAGAPAGAGKPGKGRDGRPRSPPGLHVTVAGWKRGASFYVPLPRDVPEAISSEIFRKLDGVVGPTELPPAR